MAIVQRTYTISAILKWKIILQVKDQNIFFL